MGVRGLGLESSSGGAPTRVLTEAAVRVGGVNAATDARFVFLFSWSRSATKVALYNPTEKPGTLGIGLGLG